MNPLNKQLNVVETVQKKGGGDLGDQKKKMVGGGWEMKLTLKISKNFPELLNT